MSSSWLMICAMPSTSRCNACADLLVFQQIEPGAQDAERRAQFVGGIRGEVALNPKTLLEPVQRQVDGGHQRPHLARDFAGRQPDVGAGRSDFAGDLGGLPQRPQRAAEDRDVGDQQHQQDRQRDPADIAVEIGDDIVDQHVAVGQILAGLDPDRLVADRLLDAGAGYGGVAEPLLQEFDVARILRVGWKQRGVDPSARKTAPGRGRRSRRRNSGHRPANRARAGRAAGRVRACRRDTAVRCSPTETACCCIAFVVNVVGGVVQQPRQRQRHEDQR